MAVLTLANPHWEALTPDTRSAFHRLSDLAFISRFYLAGGTGLALHLGHRFSVDLDFFSAYPDAVGAVQREALHALLDDPTLLITFDQDATFTATWRGVGISFFRLSLYPLVKPAALLDQVSVASLDEIGAMKLAAMIGRGTRKDYVDLYFILQQIPLEVVFQTAAVKYARVRTFAISAIRALAYFQDAEALPMPGMLDRTSWSTMKRFLEHQALEAGRKNLAEWWD